MAIQEVEESELAQLRDAKALLDKLATGKTRKSLFTLVKEVNPALSIPELDTEAAVSGQIGELKALLSEKVSALEEKLSAKESDEEFKTWRSKGRSALQKDGWDVDDLEKIEGLMQEEGITNWAAAGALYEKRAPKASPLDPAESYGGGWGFNRPAADDVDHELLLKNPKAFSDKMVKQFLQEQRTGKRG